MSTEQQIWQSLSSSPMNQLADLLTAYDNAIGRGKIVTKLNMVSSQDPNWHYASTPN